MPNKFSQVCMPYTHIEAYTAIIILSSLPFDKLNRWLLSNFWLL